MGIGVYSIDRGQAEYFQGSLYSWAILVIIACGSIDMAEGVAVAVVVVDVALCVIVGWLPLMCL